MQTRYRPSVPASEGVERAEGTMMAVTGEGRRGYETDPESLYELSGYGTSDVADSEGRPASDGRWWWRNVVAIVGSLFLANFAYTILEASGGSHGYTKLAPWDFVIFPAEDLFLDAPLFTLGAIPLMLVAWYMPYYWSTAKQRALVAAMALLVPLPHLIVLSGLDTIATQSNLVWFAVLTVAAAVSIQPWAMYAGNAPSAVVDVRFRDSSRNIESSRNVEEALQGAGLT